MEENYIDIPGSSSLIKVLRHAQSRANAYFIDERDPEITNLGKKQASYIKGEYDLIIISPLKRCKETLENSNIKYKKLITTPLCREYMKNHNQTNFLESEEIIPETFFEFLDRVEQFKLFLKNYTNIYPKILIISHGIFLSHLINIKRIYNCVLLDFNNEKESFKNKVNCSLIHIEVF